MAFSASVTPVAPAVLRVTFTKIPFTARDNVAYDATYKANYTLSGPGSVTLVKIRTVSGDPFSVDLVYSDKLAIGTWQLTILPVIETPSGDTFSSLPLQFDITGKSAFLAENGRSFSAEDIYRSNLNPNFKGPGWNAMAAAIGYSDQILTETAKSAFYQNFFWSASGLYLERLTNAISVDRSPNTGLSDETLRQLAIAINANRVVNHPFLEVLRAYYGDEAVTATFRTELNEPFVLSANDTLDLQINDTSVTVTFASNDFTNIGQATAFEVAQVLNRAFLTNSVSAYAQDVSDPATGLKSVQVINKWLGLYGSLLVTGGTAVSKLRFPKIIDTVSVPGVEWEVITQAVNPLVPYNKVWLRWFGGTDPVLTEVYADDYLSLYDSAFNAANRGSFQITDVGIYLGNKYVEIYNPDAVAQSPVVQVGTDTVLFLDDSATTLSKTSNYFATSALPYPNQADILLPATAAAIARDEKTAFYANGQTLIESTEFDIFRGSDGVVDMGFDSNHGLLAGSYVQLENFSPLVDRDNYFASMANTNTDNTYSFALQPSAKLLDGRFFVRKPSSWVIYDPDTNTWSETFDGSLVDRYGGAAITLDSGRVLIVGGLGGASTSEIYDPTENVIAPAGATNHPYPQFIPQLVKRATGKVYVAGTDLLDLFVEEFDPDTSIWTDMVAPVLDATASTELRMTVDGNDNIWIWLDRFVYEVNFPSDPVTTANGWYAYRVAAGDSRNGGILTYVKRGPGGQLWYIGGYNGSATVQSNVLIFDISSRSVVDRYDTGLARGHGQLLPLNNGTALLFNGTTLSTAAMPFGFSAGPPPQIVNFHGLTNSLRFWSIGDETTFNYETTTPACTLDDGRVLVVSPTQPVYHILNMFQQVSDGGVSGTFKIDAVPTPTSIQFSTPEHEWITTWQSGQITPIDADAGLVESGYILDTTEGVTTGNLVSELTVAIPPGQAPATMSLTSTDGIADAPGFIVLDFGYETQSEPIRYLGVAGNDLRLDRSFTFPRGYQIGTVGSILISTSPYAPESSLGIGVTYLTASSAGRIAAGNDIDSIKAVGLHINKQVLYPGDTGLGGNGLPTEGAQKLSDVVYVYAGDDIENELQAAREGDGQ